MKNRIITVIVLALTASAVAGAQTGRVRDSEYFPRNEVYVQYGTPSVIELTTMLNSEYRSEDYDGDSRNHKFSGIAAVGYNFFVHPRVSIGLDFDICLPFHHQQLFGSYIRFLYLLAAGTDGMLRLSVSGRELSG